MFRLLKLPTGTAAGMTDSKLPDHQSGYEKALTVSLAAMAGSDFVYGSAGMLAGLLGCSLEAMVIDDEMISSLRRTMRGFEVSDITLSTSIIDETARGIGHFLGTEQTMNLMESEYVYPVLGDRLSPAEWAEKGSNDIWERATIKVQSILEGTHPNHISEQAVAAVCAKYPIHLR